MNAATALQLIGRKVLITCDNYFFAPNGLQYRAVFGTLIGVQTSEESLGVKVSLRSQDWYVTVGRMRIAGCQVHYAIQTDECHGGRVDDWTAGEKGINEFDAPSRIFFADSPELSKVPEQ